MNANKQPSKIIKAMREVGEKSYMTFTIEGGGNGKCHEKVQFFSNTSLTRSCVFLGLHGLGNVD